MKQRKYVMITLVIIMIAVIALSVNTALAASRDKAAPIPPSHAPVCVQLDSFAPGPYELFCTDVGKDIVDVKVVTSYKYDLSWNNETVTLRVYTTDAPSGRGYWQVSDKAGSKVFGPLP
jgi:hypothetical protein